jgi:cold shock CspA family protein
MRGTVVHVNKAKGFAIVRNEENISYFAHVKKFDKQLDFDFLSQNVEVEFEPVEDPNGSGNKLRAERVRVVKDATC